MRTVPAPVTLTPVPVKVTACVLGPKVRTSALAADERNRNIVTKREMFIIQYSADSDVARGTHVMPQRCVERVSCLMLFSLVMSDERLVCSLWTNGRSGLGNKDSRPSLVYCGDDKSGKAMAAELIRDAGFGLG